MPQKISFVDFMVPAIADLPHFWSILAYFFWVCCRILVDLLLYNRKQLDSNRKKIWAGCFMTHLFYL